MCAQPEPGWLTCFRSKAPPSEVARAWLHSLSPDEREEAKADAPNARARLRQVLTSSGCPEIREDAANGYVYTAAVLRAADEVLGIPPPKATGNLRGAASGDGAPVGSRCVLSGGAPGSLGLWWSDFQTACRPYELLERGITHRLNMAAEVVKKFPADIEGLETLHVPMRDAFSNEREVSCCMFEWDCKVGQQVFSSEPLDIMIIYTYIYIHIDINVDTCIYTYVNICICICICICIYTYGCVYIYTHICL